ncbi:MAG: hypothetical protein J0I20_19370 [Chloroflexi bacterium]|nr:hypothetical protein [Chloroflexota bacterium]OJW06233.1 MAG: hypothetical protein BGO39_25650 [Chloroflexi bacterium 54-19]
MKLLLETQQLCEQYLKKVRQDPEHQLSFIEKDAIYISFQPASFDFPERNKKDNSQTFDQNLENNFQKMNLGDHTLSWLGILTVSNVLSRWETTVKRKGKWQKQYIKEIKYLLQDTGDLLLGKLVFQEAKERLSELYWYFSHNLVKADLGYMNDAAIYMFSVAIYGGNKYEVADDAVTAYTIIDRNKPGATELLAPPLPFEYDLNKRLEFWEWWLTEAIPQAWELANRTYTKRERP